MVDGHFHWRVSSPRGEVEIVLYPASLDDTTRESSVRELGRLVYDFKARDPAVRRVLLEVYAELQGGVSSGRLGQADSYDTGSPRAEAIGAELLRQARAGHLVVQRQETRAVVVPLTGVGDAEEALGPDSTPPQTETTWIAIELLGEDGKPIPGEAYLITLPDGSTREGTLDSAGKAMIRGIDPGQCGVTFPQLDEQTWASA